MGLEAQALAQARTRARARRSRLKTQRISLKSPGLRVQAQKLSCLLAQRYTLPKSVKMSLAFLKAW